METGTPIKLLRPNCSWKLCQDMHPVTVYFDPAKNSKIEAANVLGGRARDIAGAARRLVDKLLRVRNDRTNHIFPLFFESRPRRNSPRRNSWRHCRCIQISRENTESLWNVKKSIQSAGKTQNLSGMWKQPTYQSGTDCALADSIRLVLDFASRLLEVMQNAFEKITGIGEEGTC